MVRIPGPADVVALVQQQAEALAQLPATLYSIERAMRSLVLAVASAQETALALQRTAVRADRMLAELEEPVSALVPGLRRLAVVLDSDVVDTIPGTLETITAELLPVVTTLSETQARVARIAASTERLTHLVDDVQAGLGTLPGVGLLSRVRPSWGGGAPTAVARPPSGSPSRPPSGSPSEPTDEDVTGA